MPLVGIAARGAAARGVVVDDVGDRAGTFNDTGGSWIAMARGCEAGGVAASGIEGNSTDVSTSRVTSLVVSADGLLLLSWLSAVSGVGLVAGDEMRLSTSAVMMPNFCFWTTGIDGDGVMWRVGKRG